jgi:hypothetical protein
MKDQSISLTDALFSKVQGRVLGLLFGNFSRQATGKI